MPSVLKKVELIKSNYLRKNISINAKVELSENVLYADRPCQLISLGQYTASLHNRESIKKTTSTGVLPGFGFDAIPNQKIIKDLIFPSDFV